MSESNTPKRAEHRPRRGTGRKGKSDKSIPRQNIERGKGRSGNGPLDRGPTAIPPGMPAPHREESPESERAGSTEKPPGA